MTYTRHGHHIPGSDRTDEMGQIPRARCGGVPICTVCQKDVAHFITPDAPDPDIEAIFLDGQTYLFDSSDIFLSRAKLFVVSAYNNRISDEEVQISAEDLQIVVFTKFGSNWKALVQTNNPGDGFYFDVEYTASEERTHVQTFLKITTDTFSPEGD